MGRKSLIDTSPHYVEIIDMIKEGLSSTSISDYLKYEYNEIITERTIRRYVEKIKSKTASEYYKRKKEKKKSELPKSIKEKREKEEKLDEVVNNQVEKKSQFGEIVSEGVSDLDSLDNLRNLIDSVEIRKNDLEPVFDEFSIKDSLTLKIKLKSLIPSIVKSKTEVLKYDHDPSGVILPAVIIDKKEENQLRNEIKNELR